MWPSRTTLRSSRSSTCSSTSRWMGYTASSTREFAERTLADTEVLAGSGGMVEVAVARARDAGIRKKGLGLAAWIAIGWLVFLGLLAILAPILPFTNPLQGDYLHPKAGIFTAGHPLGSDDSGRDVLSRAIYGARASLAIGIGSVVFGTIIGGFLGLVAGYRGKKTDTALSAIFNIFLAFPQLVLA